VTVDETRLAILGALATARAGLARDELFEMLAHAALDRGRSEAALRELCSRGLVAQSRDSLALTSSGTDELLAAHEAIEAALDPSPRGAADEDCPSVPGLTTVQTRWIDAVSLNYAVDPRALAALLPAPLEPEIHKGSAWVQVLMSSLRDMRPQGIASLFGVCFYQISYRAAVRYRSAGAERWRRGGYFVRSETNHPIMRAVGNRLIEFKFHAFGAADMMMLRDGDRLTIGVDPSAERAGGSVVGIFDTRAVSVPPGESVWSSLEELEEPLVECHDAFGVDADRGYMYILTIDREPWNARFVRPEELYVEYFDTGPLGRGRARLDSVLHISDCAYRWRPLRRERIEARP